MADRNAELFNRARQRIPGGVNSPIRAYGAVGGTPFFAVRGDGARIWDADGRAYLDLIQSYGAVIAGHAHPAVVEAVQAAAADGTSFAVPTEREVLLAEAICDRVPSVERVRLVNSGTEATTSAVRLARGHTGRDRIVKFAGCYHGHTDSLLAEAGSAVAVFDLPSTAGVTAATVADTRVEPYNQVPALDDTVAAVIIEPIAGNMGLVGPAPGFLAGLRAECDRVGALLIFDEVITGFRVARGGAQELYGVTPDLTCMGKVIGGGLPIAAFGGRSDVMDSLAPDGDVFQAGTLSGNPLATAAGLAALDLLDEAAYERLRAAAARLGVALESAFGDAGVAVRVPVIETLVGLFCGPRLPGDYDQARTTDEDLYARFFHAMADQGVALAPGAYELMFVGLAHTDDVMEEIAAAAGTAAANCR